MQLTSPRQRASDGRPDDRRRIIVAPEAQNARSLLSSRRKCVHSAHASDALALLATLQLGDKDRGRTKELIEEYLRRFPTGTHAAEMRKRLEELR